MQSHALEAGQPWCDEELIKTLTTPDVARTLWRTRGVTADNLRQQFDHNEGCFMAYVCALHERDSAGLHDVKAAWAAYTEQARTIAK